MPREEPGDPALEIRLLGPVEVWLGDQRFDVRRQQQRVVLAILALKANRVVSSDELIDALWGERPPPTAPVALYGLVSGLRKLLGAEGADAIITTPPGYLLQLAPERIDLGRFEQLVEQGRRALAENDPGNAAARLGEALALWRGPPLHDLAFLPFAQTENARLDELRLAALEERIEADLERGRDGELVPELERLVAEHPLRERPRGQLMRALYSADRQADALAAYRDTRAVLVSELGLEPSEDLQELERAILRHDPALATGVGAIDAAGTGKARSDRSRWKRIATAGIAAATALVVAVLLATRAIRDPSVQVATDGVAVLDKGKLVAEGRAGASPSEVASGGGSVWITSSDDHTVARVNPDTGDVQDTIPVGSGAGGVAADEDGVWVTNSLEGSASRIDPRANKVVDTVSVGTAPVAVAIDHGSVWVASRDDQTLWRLDARTGTKTARIPVVGGAAPRGVAVTSHAVWVADEARGAVFRVDPNRETVVSTINVGNGPSSIVSGYESVWVANSLDGTVSRIDPRRDIVTATISVGDGPSGLAIGPEGVWVSNEFGGTVVLVNPRTDRIQRTVHIGERPEGLAAVGAKVVVAFRSDNSAHRGGTLRVATAGRPPGPPMDTLTQVPSTSLTNDGLVAFRRVGGADSTQLVPDLAVTIPTPTGQGRTYTFRVREGIRYSTGQLLQPADFRRALERDFIITRDTGYYRGIVGAANCVAKPTRCDLSRGIVTNEAARTVTFHLRAPDPDFLYKLALPYAFALPPGTPNRLARTRPLPATGPYVPERTKRAGLLVFVRNPRFKEWSKAAQPDGYPDRIEFRARPSSRAAVRATERGTADVAWVRIPPDLEHEIRTQYASQVHENPVAGVTYLFLNTRVPPFDDVRARRAINFAADRASGARMSGRGVGGDPTCQILPPDFTGFQRYCPYTARPTSSGFWRAPDLERARRLVAASGTKGSVVTVWVPDNHRGEGPFAASLFHGLGYRVRLKRVGMSFYPDLASGRVHPDPAEAGLFTWFADYPAASNYIAQLFSCGFNLSNFCDRTVDTQIRHALELQKTDPYLANRLWAKLDRILVDKAPVAPLFTLKTVDLVSRRVGNYQYSTQWGTLLAQLWVR